MSDITRKLNGELLRQTFSTQRIGEELSLYQRMAQGYAQVEQALAVLSDMRANRSYIYYGGFARILGMDCPNESEVVDSLWEETDLEAHPYGGFTREMLAGASLFSFHAATSERAAGALLPCGQITYARCLGCLQLGVPSHFLCILSDG